jgi:predicted metalloprotease with PDZ domain
MIYKKPILLFLIVNIFLFSCFACYACEDISLPGNPDVKIDWHEGLDDSFQGPDDPETVFNIDENEYITFSKVLHGTEVFVAVHKDFKDKSEIKGFKIPTPKTFSERIFKTFNHHWHVFGGYPYDRYTVKVKPFSDTQSFSLSKVGIAIGKTTDEDTPNFPPHDYAEAFDGFVQHEMFHSWLGKLIQYEPDNSGNLFQLETWVNEGGASYYGDRTASLVVSKPIYKKLMNQKLKAYKKILGTLLDLSIEGLTERIGDGPPANDQTQTILYARATLINYLLDQELKKLGFDLDILMKGLYEDFGLTGKQWHQDDIVSILKEKTGEDFSDFFNRYLLTNKKLPINKRIRFFKHANQCSTVD